MRKVQSFPLLWKRKLRHREVRRFVQVHRDKKEQSQLWRLQPCWVSGLGKTTGLRPSEATLRIVAEAEQHPATSGAAFQSKPRSPLPHLLVPLQSFWTMFPPNRVTKDSPVKVNTDSQAVMSLSSSCIFRSTWHSWPLLSSQNTFFPSLPGLLVSLCLLILVSASPLLGEFVPSRGLQYCLLAAEFHVPSASLDVSLATRLCTRAAHLTSSSYCFFLPEINCVFHLIDISLFSFTLWRYAGYIVLHLAVFM